MFRQFFRQQTKYIKMLIGQKKTIETEQSMQLQGKF